MWPIQVLWRNNGHEAGLLSKRLQVKVIELLVSQREGGHKDQLCRQIGQQKYVLLWYVSFFSLKPSWVVCLVT